MKQQKFLTGFLTLVLIIASLNPGFGQTQAQESEPYVPSGILVTELGDEVPPGRLNVRFPRRDPVQVGEEIRTILQKPDPTSDRPVLAQTVPDITPEIQTLATGLENDPLAIYDSVYNHIDYIPSWGLLKNPRETLLAGEGNAFDQAALLAALLEAAGFQTRYVWGNIRVTKAEAMNWVGSNNPSTVGNVFASGGVPTWDEGSTLLMTHIWVQVRDSGIWHSLDPSFKTYSEQTGQDLHPLLGYNLPTFISDAEDGATITGDYVQNLNQANIRDDLSTYALNLVNYLRDHDTFIYPEELIGDRQIVPIESNGYPSSLPYDVVATLGQADDIPDSFAYELTIQLPGINYTVNVDDIAGERITIFYECATPADCQLLDDGGGIYNVYPAYLVNMVPKLYIGGTVVATGDTVPLGSWGHRLDVTIATPISGWSPSFSQYLIAGEWYALPMRLQNVSNRALARQVDLFNDAISQGLDPDDERVLGQILYLLGLSYFNEVGLGDRIDARLAKIVHIPHFAMMIASRNLTVWVDVGWNPVALDPASHTVDVRMNIASAISAENPANTDQERAWFFSAGIRGSAAEHAVVEQLRPVPAISTVQALRLAIEDGQRIYYITPTNLSAVIPLLGHSTGVLNAIITDVSGGRHVVISQDPISYGEWDGSGWITLDPDSGSAGYLISGYVGSTTTQVPPVITGGSGVEPEVHLATRGGRIEDNDRVAYVQRTVAGQDLGHGQKYANEEIASDPIYTVAGSFVYHHQDLASLGGLGIPLSFERFYASSQHNVPGTLSYGWSHTYSTRFYVSTDWARGFGRRTGLEAAPALAAAQVGLDLFDATDIPHQRFAMDVTVAHWLMAQITDNAATLIEPDGTVSAHIRLIDGAYQPPARGHNLDAVAIAWDDSATLDWEDGTRLHFNPDGFPVALYDANGNSTTLSYDGQDRLIQVTDAVDRSLTFTYDVQNHLVQVSDPSGRMISYSYDGQDNLQTATDPQGGVITYTYDAGHRLTGSTDPVGTTYVTNQYDALGRVDTQIDGRGGQTSLLYGGDHTIVIDPMAYRTTYYYDRRGRLLGVKDALGNRTSIAYDAADHETSRTNRLGQTTTFAYDAWGHLTTTTNPLGHTTTWAHDIAGNPIRYTDQRGKTWQFSYNGQHNLTTVTEPVGGTTRYTYNSVGQLIQAQDPDGISVTYSYDGHGNISRVTNTLGEASHWSYDSIGLPVTFTDGTGHTWQFSYDTTDNLVQVTNPLGHQTGYTYDANGSLTGFTDASGNTTTYSYDAQFNLVSVTDAMGGATTYDYDANDGLVRITDANGHVTTYQRDQVGRLVAITDPLGRTVTFAYDAADRLTASDRADGSTIGYGRDALGRLTSIDYPTGPDVTYGYDAAGNPVSAAYGGDWSASYEYDALGRLGTVEDHGRNLTLTYEYDPAGRRTGLRVSHDTALLYDLAYGYDAAARLSTLMDQTGSPAAAIDFSYDAAGRTVRITNPGGACAEYTYDAAGLLTRVRHRDDQGGNIVTYDYTYDAAGNPTAIDETTPADSFVTTYSYDPLNRLKAETYPRYAIEYSYDPVGNLIRRADAMGTVDYTYDAADQLQSRGSESFDFDQNGNLNVWQNARGTQNYTYDYENLLTSLTLPDGTNLAFAYDAFGRRISAQGPVESWGFLHDGLDVILDGSRDLSQVTGRYLYGNNLLIGRHTDPLGFTAYHGDGLENVRYLTDRNGRPFDAYRYDAFGRPAQPAGLDPNPFRFVGQHSVYQQGLPSWPALLMGYRYYDPAGGRFLTRDPWSGDLFRPHSLNDYAYALSNPIRYNDPAGLRSLPMVALAADPRQSAPRPSPQDRGQVPVPSMIPGLGSLVPHRPQPDAPMPVSSLTSQPAPDLHNQRTWAPAPLNLPVTNQPPLGPSSQRAGSSAPVVPSNHRPGSYWSNGSWWPYQLNLWRLIRFLLRRHGIRFGTTSLEADPIRWLPVTDHGSTYAVACTANDQFLAGAFHTGLFRSTDAGHVVWNGVHTAGVGEIAVVDSNTYYVGTWYSGTLKSTNGGVSWEPVNYGLAANDVYALVADPAVPGHLFAGTEMGLFVSNDGGANWDRPAGALPGRLVSELAFSGDVLLAITDLGLYRSDDGGASWLTPTVDLPTTPINVLLASSPVGTVYAGTALGPYESTDSGDTWTAWGTGMADQDVYALAIDPADASHTVAGTTEGLFVSVDGGDTWTPDTHEGLTGIASQIGALAFCPDGGDANLYLGAGGGVYALREAKRKVYLPIVIRQ